MKDWRKLKMSKKILILSPHCDDSELGCAGYMAKSAEQGCTVKVWIATSGDFYFRHIKRVVTREERIQEAKNAIEGLGASIHSIGFSVKDCSLDLLGLSEGVSSIEAVIADFEPDEVYIPLPSFHQDHVWVHQAAIAATRINRKKFIPELIACYEYPLQQWGMGSGANPAQGGRYVNISDYIEQKINALKCYQSQIGGAGEAMSLECSVALAKTRGFESGFDYAELFYTLRRRID